MDTQNLSYLEGGFPVTFSKPCWGVLTLERGVLTSEKGGSWPRKNHQRKKSGLTVDLLRRFCWFRNPGKNHDVLGVVGGWATHKTQHIGQIGSFPGIRGNDWGTKKKIKKFEKNIYRYMILISRRIHVWYIYLHLHKNQPNVGTVNIPYMDPMGMENFLWNRADELSWSNYPKFHQASATCFPGKLSKFWLLAPGAVSKFPGQVWKTNRKKQKKIPI